MTIACGSCVGGRLGIAQKRTPLDYIEAARRVPPGHPQYRLAWQKAALAVATAQAAERGRRDLVRRGLAGLRALGDPPPVVLTREQIAAKFASLAAAQSTTQLRAIGIVGNVASLVAGVVSIFGGFISNPQDQAAYRLVISWIQTMIARATALPGAITPPMPTISPDAIAGLRGFCGVWAGAAPVARPLADGAASALAFSDINASAALSTFIGVVFNFIGGLCADPQINPPAPVAPPPPPPDGGGWTMPGGVRAPTTVRPGTSRTDCGAAHEVCPPDWSCDGTACVPPPRIGAACVYGERRDQPGVIQRNAAGFLVCQPPPSSSGGGTVVAAAIGIPLLFYFLR